MTFHENPSILNKNGDIVAKVHHESAIRDQYKNTLRTPIQTTSKFTHVDEIWNKYGKDLNEEFSKDMKKWKAKIQKAISFGQLTEPEANKLGWKNSNGKKVQILPSVLYHVTTAKDDVIKTGLKTRDELNMELGLGLGGGASDTVSFTESPEVARTIKNSLIESQKVASGKLTLKDLMNQAEKGIGAKRPWLEESLQSTKNIYGNLIETITFGVEKYRSLGRKTIKEIEEDRGKGWKPIGEPYIKNGESRYNEFEKKLSDPEINEKTFEFYKIWLSYREHAGGDQDPLFFLSDTSSLAKIDPKQIAIIQFKPIPNAQGYQMGALGEWRTFSGDAVEIVKVIP